MNSYSCCNSSSKEAMHVSTLANVLKAVAEESRLKLLCILKEGEHCVCELEEHVDLSQSLISHHLRDLKDGGFVSAEKRGLKVYYSLTNLGKEIVEKLFSITELGVDIG